MKILITDVTQMHAGNYCVAGWNAAEGRMIRPLPNGGNWTSSLLERYKIAPGVVLDIVVAGTSSGTYPHSMEDTPISNFQVHSAGFSAWLGPAAPPPAASLTEGFGGNLRWNRTWQGAFQGVHVPDGTPCPSLAAIHVSRNRLSFFEDFKKLKAIVDDGSARYGLPVSSHILRDAWDHGGLDAVQEVLPNRDIMHLRTGLARSFPDQPDKCYLMVNGVL